MRLADYWTLRAGLQRNAAPASQATRVSVASVLEQVLAESGLFHSVEVGTTEEDDRLVIAMVAFRPDVPASEVAAGLEHAWRTRVGFGFWQAHGTLVYRDQVELQGASRSSATGGFITVHVVAQAVEPTAVPVVVAPAQQARVGRRVRSWLRRDRFAAVPAAA